MELTQDFDADFDILTAGLQPGYDGPPYAFIRFADGEANIMQGRGHLAKSDGWKVPPHIQGDAISATLFTTLIDDLDGLYLGITASEHHPEQHAWLMGHVTCSWEKIAHAETFIFANYDRFCALDLSHCIRVCPGGDIDIPPDAVMTDWDYSVAATALINRATAPILVAGGPVANLLIHDYWTRCPTSRRHTILDVGSALNHHTGGRRTRQYHRPDHPQRAWKPRFWPAE